MFTAIICYLLINNNIFCPKNTVAAGQRKLNIEFPRSNTAVYPLHGFLQNVLGPLNNLCVCAQDGLDGSQALKAPHAIAQHVDKTFFRLPNNIPLPKYKKI